MGDVVIYYRGRSLRFTHEDFQRRGAADSFGNLSIYFSERWSTITGDRQIDVSHTSDIKGEEARFGGHNAYCGGIHGDYQLFASSKERRNGEGVMVLPDDSSASVVHEYGSQGTIDGEAGLAPKKLDSGAPKQPQEGLLARIFRRR